MGPRDRAKYTAAELLTTFSLNSRRNIDDERPANDRKRTFDSARFEETERSREDLLRVKLRSQKNSLSLSLSLHRQIDHPREFYRYTPRSLIEMTTKINTEYIATIPRPGQAFNRHFSSRHCFVIQEHERNDNRAQIRKVRDDPHRAFESRTKQ